MRVKKDIKHRYPYCTGLEDPVSLKFFFLFFKEIKKKYVEFEIKGV